MLESNYKLYFKAQIISFIEEYLIEEITETAPNIRENKIPKYLRIRNLILTSYSNLTDEFLDLKYKWLQQVHELAYPETKFLTFLNSEFNQSIDLFKIIIIHQTLFRYQKKSSRFKLGYSKSKSNRSNKIGDATFVIEEFVFKLCALQVATELIQKIESLNISCLNLTNLLGYTALGEAATELKLPDFTKLIQEIESLNISCLNLTNLLGYTALQEAATEPKLPDFTKLIQEIESLNISCLNLASLLGYSALQEAATELELPDFTKLIQEIEPLNPSDLNLTSLLGYSALREAATELKLPDFTKLIQKIEPLNPSDLNLTSLLGYSALGEAATELELPDFTKLIQKIESLNPSWSNLTNLLEEPATEPKLPEITGLPTPVPIRAVVESHYRPDKWKRNANNHGVFEATSKTNPNNRVEVFISGEKDGDILAWEAALQVIDLMGIDAAKLQLVFASHLFNQHNPFHSNFTLKGTEIIKQIGWDKKHRLTVSEKLAELASIAFHLGRMLMECTWVEGKPKGNKVDVSVSVSPLWVIEVDARGQKNIFTGKVDAPLEVYINVSPGPWAEKWLNRMGIKAGIALHQFGWLATEILKIDPYHEELALKLAIHLTMVSRIKVWDKNQYEHKVGSLLEAVELESRINAARQGFREAYNLKQRWDNSLALLMSMNWRVIFDDSTYPEWLRPNSQTEKPSDWRKEKIIDRLWKAKLTIKPPDPIPALLAAKTEPLQLKPVTRTKSEGILTGADIRKQRETKGVSQTALAEWAGKTKAWLCMVEKGKRKLDPKEAKELWAGIDFLANKSDQA